MQECDQILFKAVFPAVGIKRRHDRRHPCDSWKQEAGCGRLNNEIQEAGHDFRHAEPSLRRSCKYAFHFRNGPR
jgi:hypothetical protein